MTELPDFEPTGEGANERARQQVVLLTQAVRELQKVAEDMPATLPHFEPPSPTPYNSDRGEPDVRYLPSKIPPMYVWQDERGRERFTIESNTPQWVKDRVHGPQETVTAQDEQEA